MAWNARVLCVVPCTTVVILCLGLCAPPPVLASTVQNLQHLLKHPHYTDDGHQHSQHAPTYPKTRNRDAAQDQNVDLSSSTSRSPHPTRSLSANPNMLATSRILHPQQSPRSIADTVTSPSPLSQQPSVSRPSSTITKSPATNPNPAWSSIPTRPSRDFYRVLYGTHEGIQHIRNSFGPNGLSQAKSFHGMAKELEDVKQANEHFLRMRLNGRCKVPRPQVVRVKDYYPDPSKEFLPRCTVLHRCGDESGCCDTDGFRCVPRAMQEVVLHFYTLQVGRQGTGLSNAVEKLLFVNHTECECQPINDMPRLQEKPKDQQDAHNPQEPQDGRFHQQSKCRECPVPFCKREFPDGRCSCDCFDRQKPCLRIKRGREPLPEVERRCVDAGSCHVPDCEFGPFDVSSGRCPKRPDDFQRKNNGGQSRGQQNNYNHHRWTFFERD